MLDPNSPMKFAMFQAMEYTPTSAGETNAPSTMMSMSANERPRRFPNHENFAKSNKLRKCSLLVRLKPIERKIAPMDATINLPVT